MISKFKSSMTSMVLRDATLESLTPSVNAPSVSNCLWKYWFALQMMMI
jgi:hypothetical protein